MQNLKAIESNGDYGVKDIEDGMSIWWPDKKAQEEIQASEDPAAKAVEICNMEPMRGTWSN